MKKICGSCKEGELEMYGVTDSGMWKVCCPMCYHRSLEKDWGLKREAGSVGGGGGQKKSRNKK